MPNDVSLHTFPQNASEALALLYVKSQDLSDKTPSEIQTMYYDARKALKADYKQKLKSGYFND